MRPLLRPSTWRTRQWAAAIGLLLAITLLPLGWIQWRQFKLLDDLSANQIDSIMWMSYQLEREGTLLTQLTDQALGATPPDTEAFAERYEVFLSRLNLLLKIPRRDLLEAQAEYRQAMRDQIAFKRLTEPWFDDPAALLQDPVRLRQMAEALQPLRPQWTEMTRLSNRAVARFVDERNLQLGQQSLFIISLAAVQSLGLLLFLVSLVVNMRRQQTQYAQLKVLSEDLQQARDQAEAANRGKSAFLANMSHEIRTPFQGLLGMLNLLHGSNLSEQQRDQIQTARDSSLHLLGVLNDILDVSSMESGALRLSTESVHLQSVVHEVRNLMHFAAREKGLALVVETDPDLPGWVKADATRLRQIMFNLLNNAIKFTPAGQIEARFSHAPGRPGVLCFTVQDSGVGMDADTLDKLFTRFYQADDSVRQRMGGTGLGLEISLRLAQMMDGGIEVSSELGKGSRFDAYLALPECPAPAYETSVPEENRSSRSLRVLVAEDHPINQKYMAILLKQMGHAAVFCENGLQALGLLQKQDFDLVLLDYHMPELDGLATTQAIRALPAPKGLIKVLLVTADVIDATRKRAQEAGVSDFLAKPMQSSDLKRTMQRCGLLDTPAHPPRRSPPPPPTAPPPAAPTEARPPAPTITQSVFDEIVGLMKPETMSGLFKTVFSPPEGTVPELLRAMHAQDRPATSDSAHKLKGTAMLFGFTALSQVCLAIEQVVNRTDEPFEPELMEELERVALATQTALRGYDLDS